MRLIGAPYSLPSSVLIKTYLSLYLFVQEHLSVQRYRCCREELQGAEEGELGWVVFSQLQGLRGTMQCKGKKEK